MNIKIKVGREIFRSVVKLFKDHDFVKEESFGDSADNGMTANDDEDESDIDGEFVE